MHKTKAFVTSGDKTMPFDPMTLSPLSLQNILKEGEHSSLVCNLLLVLILC